MTRDDIIRMAREAEVLSMYDSETGFCAEAAIKFAALVASAEREACAKVCEEKGMFHEVSQGADLAFELAAAIRARGQA